MPLFWTGCNAIVDKGPLMSPAKMFAYMKERESKAEQQEGRNLGSSARDLFGRKCVMMKILQIKKTRHTQIAQNSCSLIFYIFHR